MPAEGLGGRGGFTSEEIAGTVAAFNGLAGPASSGVSEELSITRRLSDAVDEVFLRLPAIRRRRRRPAGGNAGRLRRATLQVIERAASYFDRIVEAFGGPNMGRLPQAGPPVGLAAAPLPAAAFDAADDADAALPLPLPPNADVLLAEEPPQSQADAYWLALFLAAGAGHAGLGGLSGEPRADAGKPGVSWACRPSISFCNAR